MRHALLIYGQNGAIALTLPLTREQAEAIHRGVGVGMNDPDTMAGFRVTAVVTTDREDEER